LEENTAQGERKIFKRTTISLSVPSASYRPELQPTELTALLSIAIQSCRATIVKLATEIEHPEPQKLLELGADLLPALKNQEMICGFSPV